MPKPPATRRDSLGNAAGLNDIVTFVHTRGRTKLGFGLVRGFTRKGVRVLPFTKDPAKQAWYHDNLLIKQPDGFLLVPEQAAYRGIAYVHLCQLLPDLHEVVSADA